MTIYYGYAAASSKQQAASRSTSKRWNEELKMQPNTKA